MYNNDDIYRIGKEKRYYYILILVSINWNFFIMWKFKIFLFDFVLFVVFYRIEMLEGFIIIVEF